MKELEEELSMIPEDNSMHHWKIDQWKEMFDKINQDQMDRWEEGLYVPYNDMEFYSEQVSNLFSYEGGVEPSLDQCLDIAQHMFEKQLIDEISDFVVHYNKRCRDENDPDCSIRNYGTDNETVHAILKQFILIPELVQQVIKKQEALASKEEMKDNDVIVKGD